MVPLFTDAAGFLSARLLIAPLKVCEGPGAAPAGCVEPDHTRYVTDVGPFKLDERMNALCCPGRGGEPLPPARIVHSESFCSAVSEDEARTGAELKAKMVVIEKLKAGRFEISEGYDSMAEPGSRAWREAAARYTSVVLIDCDTRRVRRGVEQEQHCFRSTCSWERKSCR